MHKQNFDTATPHRFDEFPTDEKYSATNAEIDEWVANTCKGSFRVEERSRRYTDEERKDHPWRGETTRVLEAFAIFDRQEDAALFKMFWL